MPKENLFDLIRREQVVIWAGAGFSRYAGYPSGVSFSEILYNDLPKNQRDEINKDLPLPNMAEEYCRFKGGSRNQLVKLLRLHFEKPPLSTEYHDKLVNIPHIKTILTTNYDALFENAFGFNATLASSDEHIPYLNKNKTEIFKVHGTLSQPSSILITSSDYTNFFKNKLEDSLFWSVVKARIATNSVLFIGYGMEDSNVDAIYEKVIESLGGNYGQCFLVAPNLSQRKVTNLLKIGIEYIDCTGEQLINELLVVLKENVVEDFRVGKVGPETFKNFLGPNNLIPDISVADNKFKLTQLKPTNEIWEGKFRFSVDEKSDANKRIQEFIANLGLGELEISSDELKGSSFWLNEVKYFDDLKEIKFLKAPVDNWLVDLRFDNGLEYFDLAVSRFHAKEGMELKIAFQQSEAIINLRVLHELRKHRYQINLQLVHSMLCSRTNDEIRLFEILYNLELNEKFTVYHNQKAVNTFSLLFHKEGRSGFKFYLEYFRMMKIVEQYYKIMFNDVRYADVNANTFKTLEIIISYINNEWLGYARKFTISVSGKSADRNENVLEFAGRETALIGITDPITVTLHGMQFVVGQALLRIFSPLVINRKSYIKGFDSKITLKSKSNKVQIKYVKSLQELELDELQ
ncbi:SIR2 family NAD-dependent protein deacylase [Dyadobacter sp. 32]|uniref:SIR2 family NAD-dependent protein deacylase n=1 Tax=Dyadobacter sp. 32 TaxID=538966 RepID=UPI0011EE9906